MNVVFFDLDGTLLKGASAERRFLRYLLGKGELQLPQLLAIVHSAILHRSIKKNKGYLKGLAVERVHAIAEHFVKERLLSELKPAIVERLRAHQHAGEVTVLLTGAPHFIAAPLAHHLGFTYCFATHFQEVNCRYQGNLPAQHPFHEEKRTIATAFCRSLGSDICYATAYADSIHDLALMKAVGRAILVHPDKQLAKALADREILQDPL